MNSKTLDDIIPADDNDGAVTPAQLQEVADNPELDPADRQIARGLLEFLLKQGLDRDQVIVHEDRVTAHFRRRAEARYGIGADHELSQYIQWEDFADDAVDGVISVFYLSDDEDDSLDGTWYAVGPA